MDLTTKIKELLSDVEVYEHCGSVTSRFDGLKLIVEYEISDITDNRKAPEHDSSDGLPVGEITYCLDLLDVYALDAECEEIDVNYDENEIIKCFYNGNIY